MELTCEAGKWTQLILRITGNRQKDTKYVEHTVKNENTVLYENERGVKGYVTCKEIQSQNKRNICSYK